ncbi:MAG: LacI family transcriptional regulator [Hyphomicrobiales bacterium]|nr:LacI family transcriptional regulator [Hyphomicrobiales bacterium]
MGVLEQSRRRVTIIDIARHTGVSKSTVSLVLKGSPAVRSETRKAIHAAMAELGYVYNRSAANLRTARTDFVGMVINDLMNPVFAELAVGLEDAFFQAGFVPLLANTNENVARQARLIHSIQEQGVAGMVISPVAGHGVADMLDAARFRAPVVTTMRRLEGSNLPYVGQDNFVGARLAVEYLLQLGHRRIAFLGGLENFTTRRERIEGYQTALRGAGIAPDPALIIEGPPTRAGGAASLAAALDRDAPPTAAMAYNDMVAIGAIGLLRERGLEAGRDVSIVGFDDIAEAEFNAPPLTTIACNTRGLGGTAADLLKKIIEGGAAPTQSIIGPARLVIRKSCGAPPR